MAQVDEPMTIERLEHAIRFVVQLIAQFPEIKHGLLRILKRLEDRYNEMKLDGDPDEYAKALLTRIGGRNSP
jgi:hypothetical protein